MQCTGTRGAGLGYGVVAGGSVVTSDLLGCKCSESVMVRLLKKACVKTVRAYKPILTTLNHLIISAGVSGEMKALDY